MIAALVQQSVAILLIWGHGDILIAQGELDSNQCAQVAKDINEDEDGFLKAVCVQKSCIDLISEVRPGWIVQCIPKDVF